MPKLKEVNINYNQIKELIGQLDFERRMKLVKEVINDEKYRKNFYKYTEMLKEKYKIPELSEIDLDTFLHEKS